MVDRIDKQVRSANMSRIRSKDTKPELKVRKILHKLGYRFRLHRKDIPGRPDIVLPKHKTVVFVNGCFWHRHSGCKSYNPKSKVEFWQGKFKDNQARDKIIKQQLSDLGWRQLVIWECETKDKSRVQNILRDFLSDKNRHTRKRDIR